MRRDRRCYGYLQQKRARKRRYMKYGLGMTGIVISIMLVHGLYGKKYIHPQAGSIEQAEEVMEQGKLTEGKKPGAGENAEDQTKPTQLKEDELTQASEGQVDEIGKDTEENAKDEMVEKEYIGVSDVGKAYGYNAKKVAKKLSTYDYYQDDEKIVFLTFDDGASTSVTPKVLDVLKEYDVKATFFVIGKTVAEGGDRAANLIRREFEEGHAIANHTYGHDYSKLYPQRTLNLEYFVEELNKTDELLKEILGVNFRTRVFRCPGGFMSWNQMEPLTEYQKREDRVSIDWNALIKDAEGNKKNASQLFDCMIETSKDKDMVVLLMHDTYGKEETAKALPKIIRYYKERGYQFKTLI